MRLLTRVLAAALLLSLGACAELSRSPADGYEFELAGRFAARYRGEAASGSLAWRHESARDEVLLSSPFGQGLARITREGDTVTLVTGEDKRYTAKDAEALTEQVLGFRLPLQGLADWVRGRPVAGVPLQVAENGPDGRLLVLEQQGWRIEYGAYQGTRPTRLKLTYPELELRLAISTWK